MKKFILLLTFLIECSSFAATSIHQVTSVQFESKDRVWVCLQGEESLERCYLAPFHALIKPRSFYRVTYRLSKNKQTGQIEFKSLGSKESKAIVLDIFKVKKAATKKAATTMGINDKSYLEQHDPRTDYMIF